MQDHIHDHETAADAQTGQIQRRDTSDVQRALAGGEPAALGPGAVLNLQRAAGNSSVSQFVQREEDDHPVHDVIGSGGGRPLDDDVRGRMEQSLGHDFGDVRIHTDERAADSAAAVQARAYTSGSNVVFGAGQYAPGTTEGDRTIAHELTHVVQQRSGPVDGTPTAGGISVSDPSDRFEQAADAAADAALSGAPPVQRQEAEEELVEEEPVQTLAVQRQEAEEELVEEEPVQTLAVQRQEAGEEEEELAP
jgi:hypothetical protein